jgi:hypothetical protein
MFIGIAKCLFNNFNEQNCSISFVRGDRLSILNNIWSLPRFIHCYLYIQQMSEYNNPDAIDAQTVLSIVFVCFFLEGGIFNGENLPKLKRNSFCIIFFAVKYSIS